MVAGLVAGWWQVVAGSVGARWRAQEELTVMAWVRGSLQERE